MMEWLVSWAKKRMLKSLITYQLDELEQLLARQNIRAYCLGREDRLENTLDPETKEAVMLVMLPPCWARQQCSQVFRPVRLLNSSGKVGRGTGSNNSQLILMDPAVRQSLWSRLASDLVGGASLQPVNNITSNPVSLRWDFARLLAGRRPFH